MAHISYTHDIPIYRGFLSHGGTRQIIQLLVGFYILYPAIWVPPCMETPMWLWVKSYQPGEHQNFWQMDVQPLNIVW